MSDGTGTPSELERQIEAARVDLARSVDAIVDRVHPRKVMQRTVTRVKERVGLLPAHANGVAGELTAGEGSDEERDGLPVPKEYLIAAAGAVVVAGAVAIIIWRRRRS